ncbi:unnamed protein product [Owenia fusiformis]|uniref:Innexin n=1 Tax=Owenia fusiformis TaxID=6347 RepID=A0A8J1TCM9_OWEFU|nr:unnamed protein product [Owenia fusiformis]
MSGIIYEAFKRIHSWACRSDDDFADRLNYRYTAMMLVITSMLVSAKTYVGDPIHCWTPLQFSGAHVDYTNNYCWIKNTYKISHIGSLLPDKDVDRQESEIGYYQWVPIVLVLQAVLFYIPCLIWRMLNSNSGINLHRLTAAVEDVVQNPENRDKTVEFMVRTINRCLKSQKDTRKGLIQKLQDKLAQNCCLFCGKRYGNYLLPLYYLCKVLYIVNAIGQLYLLNSFIGSEYNLYGFQVLRDLINGTDWTESQRFPRVTLCDFYVRERGQNIHRHTVQCVLPINLFNEKIYIIIWFWLVILAGITIFSLLRWFYTMCFSSRSKYIKEYLRLVGDYDPDVDRNYVAKFADNYLRQDGTFVLHMLDINLNDVVMSEVISGLWEHYKENECVPLSGFHIPGATASAPNQDDVKDPNAPFSHRGNGAVSKPGGDDSNVSQRRPPDYKS